MTRRLAILGIAALAVACAGSEDEPEIELEPGTLLLSTSLDGPSTVTMPEVGYGEGASVWTPPTEHFVQTLNGLGVLLDADGQWIRFRVRDPSTRMPNLDLRSGTVGMWLRPGFPVLDGQRRDLFAALDDEGRGLRVAKGGHAEGNALLVELIDVRGEIHRSSVASDDLPWLLLAWERVQIAWDATGQSDHNVRVWVDEVELPYTESTDALIDMPRLPDDAHLYWGAWGIEDPQALRGTLDELRVWSGVVSP